MKELFTCASCGDCAVRLGCEGVPVQAIEAIEADVNGRVGYGCEVMD